MHTFYTRQKSLHLLLMLAVLITSFLFTGQEASAATFPTITVDFDPNEQSVIVSGIPAYDASGTVEYELHGYLNYEDERVETFSYDPATYSYHVPDKQAYIFNWTDAEFLLPCS